MKEMKLNVLIHKKLTGEISAEELLHLDALLVTDVDNLEEEISGIWDMSNNYEPQVSFKADNAFSSLMDRITTDIEESVVEEEVLPKESIIIKLAPKQEEDIKVKTVRAASMFSLRNMARIAAVFIFALTAYMTYDNINGDVYTSGATSSCQQ